MKMLLSYLVFVTLVESSLAQTYCDVHKESSQQRKTEHLCFFLVDQEAVKPMHVVTADGSKFTLDIKKANDICVENGAASEVLRHDVGIDGDDTTAIKELAKESSKKAFPLGCSVIDNDKNTLDCASKVQETDKFLAAWDNRDETKVVIKTAQRTSTHVNSPEYPMGLICQQPANMPAPEESTTPGTGCKLATTKLMMVIASLVALLKPQ